MGLEVPISCLGRLQRAACDVVNVGLTAEWAWLPAQYIFDIKDDDIVWCTADCGWVTGHSYLVYGGSPAVQ